MEENRQDMLEELLTVQRASARRSLIMTVAVVVLAVGLLVAIFTLVPRLMTVMDHMETTLENINTWVEANTDAASGALQKMNELDIDSLNQAINDLADVVRPLANLSNLFH